MDLFAAIFEFTLLFKSFLVFALQEKLDRICLGGTDTFPLLYMEYYSKGFIFKLFRLFYRLK